MHSTLHRHPGGHAMRPPEHSLSALQSTLHVPLLHELQIEGHAPAPGGVAPHTGMTLASAGSTSEPPVDAPAPPAPASVSIDPPAPPRDGVASARSAPFPLSKPASSCAPPEPASSPTPPEPEPPSPVTLPEPEPAAPAFPPASTSWLVGPDPPLPVIDLTTGRLPVPDASRPPTSGTHTPRTDWDESQIHPAMQGHGRPAIRSVVRSDEQPAAAAKTARLALRNHRFTRNHSGRRHTTRPVRRRSFPLDAVAARRRSDRSRA